MRIDERWRPCIAIVLAKGPMRPAVIPLEDAWRWSDLIGTPFQAAARVLEALGVAITQEHAFKLVSLVNSRMQDLVSMPPRPPDAEEHAEPVALVTTKDPVHGRIEAEI